MSDLLYIALIILFGLVSYAFISLAKALEKDE